jgi:hypothetical protein
MSVLFAPRLRSLLGPQRPHRPTHILLTTLPALSPSSPSPLGARKLLITRTTPVAHHCSHAARFPHRKAWGAQRGGGARVLVRWARTLDCCRAGALTPSCHAAEPRRSRSTALARSAASLATTTHASVTLQHTPLWLLLIDCITRARHYSPIDRPRDLPRLSGSDPFRRSSTTAPLLVEAQQRRTSAGQGAPCCLRGRALRLAACSSRPASGRHLRRSRAPGHVLLSPLPAPWPRASWRTRATSRSSCDVGR